MPPRIMLTSQNSAPPMLPITSKGERGRPVGEPEAFSDYSIIYELMKNRGKKTETKRNVRRNTELSAKVLKDPPANPNSSTKLTNNSTKQKGSSHSCGHQEEVKNRGEGSA